MCIRDREGYEFQVSKPKPATKIIGGVLYEPYEHLTIDTSDDYIGVLTQDLADRLGLLIDMVNDGTVNIRLTCGAGFWMTSENAGCFQHRKIGECSQGTCSVSEVSFLNDSESVKAPGVLRCLIAKFCNFSVEAVRTILPCLLLLPWERIV